MEDLEGDGKKLGEKRQNGGTCCMYKLPTWKEEMMKRVMMMMITIRIITLLFLFTINYTYFSTPKAAIVIEIS